MLSFFPALSLGVSANCGALRGNLADCRPNNKRFIQFSLACGPAFQIEMGTAPGISCASIMHCQDWRRLLCQNNNVDIHHERPSTPHPIFSHFQPLTQTNLCGFSLLYGISHRRSLSFFIPICCTVLAFLIYTEQTASPSPFPFSTLTAPVPWLPPPN